MDALFALVPGFLEQLAAQHPNVALLLMGVGLLRVLLKPLMSLLQAYVLWSPSPDDDSKLAALLESAPYKSLAYALDWAASIKLPAKK